MATIKKGKTLKTIKSPKKAKKRRAVTPRKIGRPTKYRSRYCEDIIKFFKAERGDEWFPTIQEFATYELDVDTDTIKNWADQYKEFFGAYIKAKEIQTARLQKLGLTGKCNVAYAIFLSKNIAGMKDRVDTDLTTQGDKVEGVNLTSILNSLKNKSIDELQKEATRKI